MSAPRGLETLAFHGRWRHYQELALAAFDRDREAGSRRTHIIAPPGSGKTLIGVETILRVGVPAVVLVPNTAVQEQWLRAVEMFGAPPGTADTTPDAVIAVLTYQALCRLDDPESLLGDLAAERWARERAAAIGRPGAEVAAEARAWQGEAARRRTKEIARITATIKREIARSAHGDLHLGSLLHAGARERLDALRAGGAGTVVLDECHHLASMWGYMVRVMLEELGDPHVIGLTATPPGELTEHESDLYEALLGPVDFTVPTPAVVREGHLAPFQELAWLTEPLSSESAWLSEHDSRFRDLVAALHEDMDGPLSFPSWVLTRMRERGRPAEDAQVSWPDFSRRSPRLARAGARFIGSAGLARPQGMPNGEGYREEPNLEDWLVLLEDYALRCLRVQPSEEAARRDRAVAAALHDLGFTLTRRGIRRGRSDVDRLLTTSGAKSIALTEVLSLEEAHRGEGIRALVLCDAELAEATPDDELRDVLRAGAGTAIDAVLAIAADPRTAGLRPVLVSGRGLRCAQADADALLGELRRVLDDGARELSACAEDGGLVRIDATGEWRPRVWVAAATAVFAAGAIRAIVGTRALLGEGWDAPSVNCLVDLTAAATRVSVTQMRGRSLRLDPRDPAKLSTNWDIVCVAPELARGDADYSRFVRKHLHLLAPTDDGAIEAGPTHVHPALTPFAPPPSQGFAEVNAEMGRRAGDPDRARALWGIGAPYAGDELDTLVVRPRRSASPGDLAPQAGLAPPAFPMSPAPAALTSAGALAAATATATALGPIGWAALAAAPLGLVVGTLRMARLRRELSNTISLAAAAYVVRDAYLSLAELSEGAAASLTIEPRASGYLRVWLKEADPAESAIFIRALGAVVDPEGPSRYLVSRMVPGTTSSLRAFSRTLVRRAPFEGLWTPVPEDLARHKTRAEAFARAWRLWMGPGELVFTQRHDQGRAALAEASAQRSDHEASVRRVWV